MISPEVTNRLIMSQRCTAYSRGERGGGFRHELPQNLNSKFGPETPLKS